MTDGARRDDESPEHLDELAGSAPLARAVLFEASTEVSSSRRVEVQRRFAAASAASDRASGDSPARSLAVRTVFARNSTQFAVDEQIRHEHLFQTFTFAMRVLCALLGTVAAWLQPVQPPRRHVLRRHLLEKPADVASTPPATGVSTLVLLRHGESVWNVKDDERFTGWCDVPLTVKGEREAEAAGRTLRDSNLRVDVCFTSLLSRATVSAGVPWP